MMGDETNRSVRSPALRAITVVAAALTVFPTVAWSNFKCTPPGSKTPHYYDYLPPECAGVEARELNQDGSLKRIIPPPLTQEQKRAIAEKEKRKADCRKQNQARAQEDDALLERHLTEDTLQAARYRALGDQLKRIDQANDRLKGIRLKRKELEEQAKFFEPPHQMPVNLAADLDANHELEQNELQTIEDASLEIQRTNDRFDADLKRYREVVNGTAKPSVQCEE
jgi:hypothetical protein